MQGACALLHAPHGHRLTLPSLRPSSSLPTHRNRVKPCNHRPCLISPPAWTDLQLPLPLQVLVRLGAALDAVDADGNTALFHAAAHSHSHACQVPGPGSGGAGLKAGGA